MSHQPQRVKVLVAGKAIDASAIRHASHDFQIDLHSARDRFGSAMCLCQSKSLPLVIRERGGKLFLAAWPEQAAAHALDCPFYSERSEGAQTHSNAGAIQRLGDRTTISLHHGLYKQAQHSATNRSAAGPLVKVATVNSNKYARMHLWGLLHYLWEEAGLNRWIEGWSRDWGFLRYVVRRAAQSTFVDDSPLIQKLYIPPVWSEKKRVETSERWRDFVAPLLLHHGQASIVESGFVIGSVRSLETTQYGYVLKLHHMPERFYIDTKMAEILAVYSRRGWSALKHLDVVVHDDHKPHVVGALRIRAAQSGRLVVVEAALMRVSPRYIPVDSSYEDVVARLLVKDGRSFVRPLHYDNHALRLPDFVLKDAKSAQGQPHTEGVAMFVYGATIAPVKKRKLEAADRRAAADANLQYWQWDAGTNAQPPPFPDKSNPPSV